MATIIPHKASLPGGAERVTWYDVATGDTVEGQHLTEISGVNGAVQFAGTFGGATAGLQVSNDGVNWHNLEDAAGVDGWTAGGMLEFSTAAAMLRPYVTGGSGDAVDVIVVIRPA